MARLTAADPAAGPAALLGGQRRQGLPRWWDKSNCRWELCTLGGAIDWHVSPTQGAEVG